MSRVKNPIEKKRLSLEKDHRVFALEGNKSFRKAWRLKKRGVVRNLRRTQPKVEAEAETPTRKQTRSLKKLGVMSLSQAMAFKAGKFGSRWESKVLGKNKEALRASKPRARKPHHPK